MNWETHPHEAKGLDGTFAHHIAAIQSYKVELGAGDLLYVPPWWLHAVLMHSGYSVGISARGLN